MHEFLRWFQQPRLPHDRINNPLVDADFPHRVAGALRVYFRGLTQVLFPWRLVEEVKRLSPDEGLNLLRRRHGAQYVVVSDRAVLDDIDTPDDYQRLHATHGGPAGEMVESRPAT